jgi:uncharacterized RDD family membrane protein YckC
MKKLIARIRKLSVFIRIILFIAIAILIISAAILLTPSGPDEFENAKNNGVYWLITAFALGYVSVIFFGKSKTE